MRIGGIFSASSVAVSTIVANTATVLTLDSAWSDPLDAGSRYRIEVKNPEHVSKGVARVRCDGVLLEENMIVPSGDALVHEVEIIMGDPPSRRRKHHGRARPGSETEKNPAP